ncbi:MAG: S41 family peptidase [Bacteroidales bacterium]|nr:S41 family peptidase [Bacteroidales bacterium]
MNHDSRIKLWLPVIGAVIFVGGMWLGYLLADGDTLTPGQQKLNDIFRMIDEEYVDEIDQDSLIEMTIPGLLHNLDPHSLYVPKDELERVNRDLESSFFGIGIQFQIMSDSICVVEVISGGPAERAGVMAGDRIVAVDGKPMTGPKITNDDVFGALRGARDTQVKITVNRQTSAKPIDFEITRGEIPSVSVDASYMLEDNIGYIRLSKFAANTYSEFLQALNSLSNKGAENYVLDLRGNTGGLLDQAILIANEFLDPYRGIVSTKGRNQLDDANWLADGTGAFADLPLVVLMDEFSASSSEIVAGAIQDNDRGLIIGRRSFGKGLVQRQITLPDSSQLRLTVQRYYTPSGRCIQKDFTRGSNDSYETEIYDRYSTGEIFNVDSVKINTEDIFFTMGGRKVYGGGGIMPDIFVPSDTTGLTSYYFSVANAGLLQKFAYEYADLNRAELTKAKTVDQLLGRLPSQEVLLSAFIQYAKSNGIAPRWYYINNSSKLIVNQLRALIARDILGMNAYYQITNSVDPTVKEAISQIRKGVDATIQSSVNKKDDE